MRSPWLMRACRAGKSRIFNATSKVMGTLVSADVSAARATNGRVGVGAPAAGVASTSLVLSGRTTVAGLSASAESNDATVSSAAKNR